MVGLNLFIILLLNSSFLYASYFLFFYFKWIILKKNWISLLTFNLLTSPPGEVQGWLEEDPQACDWHGWVSVHAAQPQHQQTVQQRKTPSPFNPLTFPPQKLLGGRSVWAQTLCGSLKCAWSHSITSKSATVTTHILQMFNHLMDLLTKLHHPNIHCSLTSSGSDPCPPRHLPFDLWPSHSFSF